MPFKPEPTYSHGQAARTAIVLCNLGTHLADPRQRMGAILHSTGKVKQALAGLKSVLPTDYPSLLAPWVMGGAAKALARSSRSAMVNIVRLWCPAATATIRRSNSRLARAIRS